MKLKFGFVKLRYRGLQKKLFGLCSTNHGIPLEFSSAFSMVHRLHTKCRLTKNRSKSRVRSKVEHVFAVMKLKFGFVKLRFRGLKKNATQLFAVCALVNLYLARKKLLLLAPA